MTKKEENARVKRFANVAKSLKGTLLLMIEESGADKEIAAICKHLGVNGGSMCKKNRDTTYKQVMACLPMVKRVDGKILPVELYELAKSECYTYRVIDFFRALLRVDLTKSIDALKKAQDELPDSKDDLYDSKGYVANDELRHTLQIKLAEREAAKQSRLDAAAVKRVEALKESAIQREMGLANEIADYAKKEKEALNQAPESRKEALKEAIKRVKDIRAKQTKNETK